MNGPRQGGTAAFIQLIETRERWEEGRRENIKAEIRDKQKQLLIWAHSDGAFSSIWPGNKWVEVISITDFASKLREKEKQTDAVHNRCILLHLQG